MCVCVVEDPNCVEVIMDTAIQDTDVISENTQVTKKNVKETTEDEAEIESEVITCEKEKIVTQEVTDVAIENVPSNQQAVEEKIPLLRVRSFAKPPTTWEDNTKQKTDKTVEKSVSKIEKEKEVIDLTNETAPKPVTSNKCTIKIGNKVLPLIKNNVLIPAGNKNIISVQNITNNYLKFNTRTGQIITPVRDIPSIILSSGQTNSLQNQPQNSNAGICKSYRIIQPKSISIGKKTTVQPTVKLTDVCSANAKKPK